MRLTVVQQIETCVQVRDFCGCAKHNYQIFRVYGLKQRFMYLGALKLVSIFQQGKLVDQLPSLFCESVLSDLQSSLRKVNHCIDTRTAATYLTVSPILPQLQITTNFVGRSWVDLLSGSLCDAAAGGSGYIADLQVRSARMQGSTATVALAASPARLAASY